MKHIYQIAFLCLVILTVQFLPVTYVQAKEPTVHALLFYSQSCPHCHKVITEELPPLLEKHSDQLIILGVDTYTEQGFELYEAAIRHYQIPQERLGVPTLIVGDAVMVGSLEIPQQFPSLVENGLATGGINWPEIPELQKLLETEGISNNEGGEPNETVQNEPVEKEANTADLDEKAPFEKDTYSKVDSLGINTDLEEASSTTEQLTLSERFARDKTGNIVSVVLLIGMVLSVVGVGTRVSRLSENLKTWPTWVVPVLVIIGTVVAIYMGFVEVTETEAICGPVGDCNTVQQSSYASLFGIIPIGVFGVAGYLVFGFAWLITVYGPEKWRGICTVGLWILSLFGALFSIYLTFLEPFVIGATCAWCLTSAVVMNLLLWAITAPAQKVWNQYRLVRK